MNVPSPVPECPSCSAYFEQIKTTLATLDISANKMTEALATRDKQQVIESRDEVMKTKETVDKLLALYTDHLEKHEAVSN
jgi:hypothetical protein